MTIDIDIISILIVSIIGLITIGLTIAILVIMIKSNREQARATGAMFFTNLKQYLELVSINLILEAKFKDDIDNIAKAKAYKGELLEFKKDIKEII